MNKYALVLIIMIISLTVSGQGYLTIRGKVLSTENKKPIAFANIGILETKIGTLSNHDGSFLIRIPDSYLKERLIFSAIGYGKKTISISSLHRHTDTTIFLDEKITTLKNVTILASDGTKSHWIGHKKHPLLLQGQLHYDSASAGGAMALLVENHASITSIQKAALWIARNSLDTFKIRVRFLEVDSSNNNLPGSDLFLESIIETSSIKKGWLTFDLSEYNYLINQAAFYVMFEWIIEDQDRRNIAHQYDKYMKLNPGKVYQDTLTIEGEKVHTTMVRNFVAGTMFGVTKSKSDLNHYKCYARSNSFGEWKRASAILSAKVLVKD